MAQALERPVCTARIAEDDSVEVTIDRVPYEFDSMPAAIAHVVSIADDLGRPVKLTAIDPTSVTEPETRLIVAADGSVTADASASMKKRPSRGGSSRVVTVDDLVSEPEETTRPVAATEPAADLSERQPAEPSTDAETPQTLPKTDVPHSGDASELSDTDPRPETTAGDTPAGDPAPSSSTPTPVVAEAGDPRLQLRRETTTETPESPARHGWRGWCNQTLGLSLAASPAERASRARRVRIQRPLETHRTVAVLQLKGGGGKTTTAYHLAATAGRVRGGNILAGEFNENQGTLAERSLAGGHDRTTLDLIRNLETVTRRTADLVRYVRPQGDDRIHVLASPPEGTDRTRVDGRSVRSAHETLSSLYSLILLDTGNSAQSSTWRAAVDVADSLVLVAHNREDDARLLEATVAAVQAEGHGLKLARSVLVVSNTATNNTERLTRLQEYAQAVGLAGTVVIPFDKSLQEGRAFHYDALHPATVRAYEEATATLIDQL
jgi:MinD-like ATPase involved in chromosome partitioning or flagellar assembly